MTSQTEHRQFFKGAFILTYAGLLGKVLSAIYRIPLQNLTGDVGFYIYQQIYPFVGIAMVLALYGFPAAISKLMAGQTNRPTKQLKQKIIIQLTIFSSALSLVLFLLAPFIADFMGDSGLTSGIRASAMPFLLVPFVAYFRGMFQGRNNMLPTAGSQLVEQIVRVSLIIITAYLTVELNRSLYDIGVGTAIASTGGSLVALMTLLVFFYRKPKEQHLKVEMRQTIDENLFTAVIGYGIAIAINHMMLLLLQLMDAFTLVPLLKQTGYSLTEAQVLKGVLDRGQPLAQLGIVAASSLALAMIPSATKLRLSSDRIRFTNYIASTWRFTLYLASGATVGLIVLFPEVNTLLYKEDLATLSLQVFSITIIFSALSISTASILHGLGQIYRTAFFVVIGVVVKLGLNFFFVPQLGILGAAIATVIASVTILGLNLNQLKKVTPKLERIRLPWFRFVSSLLVMGIVVYGLNRVARPLFYQYDRIGQLFYLLCLIGIGVISYLFCLVKLSVFTKEERDVLPFKFLIKD
ncbi:MAG TPA: polysaccharide biosynthesis protein [Bacilli bacterium]|nr:polysaccharide biosynthesis protein [Bacilli bacterium]